MQLVSNFSECVIKFIFQMDASTKVIVIGVVRIGKNKNETETKNIIGDDDNLNLCCSAHETQCNSNIKIKTLERQFFFSFIAISLIIFPILKKKKKIFASVCVAK